MLLPFNYADALVITLRGEALADTDLAVVWNGAERARAKVRRGQAVEIVFDVAPPDVLRGVNVVDLVHDGVALPGHAARYDAIEMRKAPTPTSR